MYQPQLALSDGKLVGVEALLRWRHPDLGLIPPDKFIPLAEKTGLINTIGEWVADAACCQTAAWMAQGYLLPRVSINVSAEQFRRGNIPQSMHDLLEQYQLSPEQLVIELTETALMVDPEQAQKILRKLKDMGLLVSIDDFGTGYSSLAHLRRFSIDELKIDRHFVNEVASCQDDRAIARTILAMAESLNLSAVAEGIETQEQCNVLHDLGCRTGQGFLFAEAISAEELMQRFPLTQS